MALPQLEDFDPDDPASVATWVDLHDRRHRTYCHVLGQTGVANIRAPFLTGKLTADWFQRNLNAHAVLATLVAAPIEGSTVLVSVAGLHDQRAFRDWMRAHNLAHARADQALGV